jgi:uncharacterized repeat protein (TIGR03833 family)
MICPFCKSEKIRGIIYGDIGFRDAEDEKDFEKKFVEGGDKMSDESPAFHCDNCGRDFGAMNEQNVKKAVKTGTNRQDVKPGIRVKIVLKKDQPTGKLTEGVVQDVLTSSSEHHRGIKVRLADGQVGRVQQIL